MDIEAKLLKDKFGYKVIKIKITKHNELAVLKLLEHIGIIPKEHKYNR